MSDFDTRPQGTVMYGAFNAFAAAERALRVLKNAGYARAALEHADEGDGAEVGDPTVVVVDAAKTGAARAAEILEEFGARIYSTPPRALAPETELPERTVLADVTLAVPLHVTSSLERKPRVRKRRRAEMPRPNGQSMTSEPPLPEDVIIITRTIESLSNDG